MYENLHDLAKADWTLTDDTGVLYNFDEFRIARLYELIYGGADPCEEDEDGMTPMDYALKTDKLVSQEFTHIICAMTNTVQMVRCNACDRTYDGNAQCCYDMDHRFVRVSRN